MSGPQPVRSSARAGRTGFQPSVCYSPEYWDRVAVSKLACAAVPRCSRDMRGLSCLVHHSRRGRSETSRFNPHNAQPASSRPLPFDHSGCVLVRNWLLRMAHDFLTAVVLGHDRCCADLRVVLTVVGAAAMDFTTIWDGECHDWPQPFTEQLTPQQAVFSRTPHRVAKIVGTGQSSARPPKIFGSGVHCPTFLGAALVGSPSGAAPDVYARRRKTHSRGARLTSWTGADCLGP